MKRILIIQDMCASGKSSSSLSVSLFAAMGIETVMLPLYFHCPGNFSFDINENTFIDLSDNIYSYVAFLRDNKIHFDGIFISGVFLEKHLDIVNNVIDNLTYNDCLLFLGIFNYVNAPYDIMVNKKLQDLCSKSNIVAADYKSLGVLLNINYDTESLNQKEYPELLVKSFGNFCFDKAVVTGFNVSDTKECVISFEKDDDKLGLFYHKRYNTEFPGLSDIFFAVLSGFVLRKSGFSDAIRHGINFTETAIKETLSEPSHNWYGVSFERVLKELVDSASELE